jgi:hypothetical protein
MVSTWNTASSAHPMLSKLALETRARPTCAQNSAGGGPAAGGAPGAAGRGKASQKARPL